MEPGQVEVGSFEEEVADLRSGRKPRLHYWTCTTKRIRRGDQPATGIPAPFLAPRTWAGGALSIGLRVY